MNKINDTIKMISQSLLEGYEHIHLLNGLSFSDDYTLYKYMPYNRLNECVQNKELVFVSPETWIDPFERRFWETDYSSKYGYHQPEIACMCLTTKSTTNEEASWKMYSDSTSKALRISFNKNQLFNILNSYALNNNCEIYIGKAIYTYDRKAIIGLHNQANVFFPIPPAQFTLIHYLTLMCLKRKSFAFENEIRIFIVKKNLDWTGNLIKVKTNIDNKLIPRIIIGPLNPFSPTDPRRALFNTIQKAEEGVYKKRLSNIIPGCKIHQSQLYTDKRPLKKV